MRKRCPQLERAAAPGSPPRLYISHRGPVRRVRRYSARQAGQKQQGQQQQQGDPEFPVIIFGACSHTASFRGRIPAHPDSAFRQSAGTSGAGGACPEEIWRSMPSQAKCHGLSISFPSTELVFSRSSQYNARKRNRSQTFFPSGVKVLDRDLRDDGKGTLG